MYKIKLGNLFPQVFDLYFTTIRDRFSSVPLLFWRNNNCVYDQAIGDTRENGVSFLIRCGLVKSRPPSFTHGRSFSHSAHSKTDSLSRIYFYDFHPVLPKKSWLMKGIHQRVKITTGGHAIKGGSLFEIKGLSRILVLFSRKSFSGRNLRDNGGGINYCWFSVYKISLPIRDCTTQRNELYIGWCIYMKLEVIGKKIS